MCTHSSELAHAVKTSFPPPPTLSFSIPLLTPRHGCVNRHLPCTINLKLTSSVQRVSLMCTKFIRTGHFARQYRNHTRSFHVLTSQERVNYGHYGLDKEGYNLYNFIILDRQSMAWQAAEGKVAAVKKELHVLAAQCKGYCS